MAPERVTHEGEISLNAVRYRLVEGTKVRSSIVSYPEKQVFGDFTKDSQRFLSTAAWSDFSDGMGRERMESQDTKRSWWSTCEQRKARRVTLPPLATQTAVGSAAAAPLIGELGGTIMAAFGTAVDSYAVDAWTNRGALAAVPTDVLNFNLDAAGTRTEYLAFCYTTNYAYATSPTGAWTAASAAKATLKMAYWDNKLWGISATGLLWYTFTIGGSNEVNDAQLPLSHNDAVTGLFVGLDSDGVEILYATTKKWLWAHDFGNRLWERKSIAFPANLGATAFSRQAAIWRNDIMLAANTGFLRFRPSSREDQVAAILLGHDDGLKNTKEGRVFCMAESIGDLLIGTIPVNSTDSAAIFQWNDENGFQVLWEAEATNLRIDCLHVSDAVTNYRCWFGYNNRVWWIRLHDSVANPGQVQGWTYSGRDLTDTNPIIQETPWFNADQEEVTKILLRVKVETEGCTATEAVRVRYGTNYSTAWTQFTDVHTSDTIFDATDDRIEGNGITTFSLPSVAAPAGLAFRAIRFERAVRRGTTTTVAPISNSLWIEFLKVLPDKWTFEFDVDLMSRYSSRSALAARATLLTAIESDLLVEFTYRDDTGDDRNFYVKVFQVQGTEETGHDERGVMHLRAVEI